MALLTDWQRIERVVKWTGFAVNGFAREIGLTRAENLYQIRNGNNGISRNLANIITAKYPQISKGWLLTGEGDMFTDEAVRKISIPFYDADAEKYIKSPNSFGGPDYVSVPMIEDADFATMYYGRAMGESIPPGSIVLFKGVAPESLVPGGDYLVVADNLVMLRRVRRNVDSGLLRLLPVDVENFDEIRIDESQIKELYLVRAVIINKTI